MSLVGGWVKWSMMACTLVACASYPEARPVCGRGFSDVEGQCVPVSTVVFRQCMEAFRTESVEHDRSQQLSIGASAKGYGDANVHRAKQDLERTEFSGAAAGDSEVVIAECRRQEQAERDSQLAHAWAAAEVAEAEARRARDESAVLARDLEAAQAELAAQERKQEETAANNHQRALELYARGCELEDASACANLAAALEREDAALEREDAAVEREDVAVEPEDVAVEPEDVALPGEDG